MTPLKKLMQGPVQKAKMTEPTLTILRSMKMKATTMETLQIIDTSPTLRPVRLPIPC